MDHSFAYNAASRPDDFLGRDELLETVVDVAAKGGNLLLNVGPRGVDAAIPEEQRRRLSWLAEARPALEAAVFGSRPWVVPGGTTVEGDPVRYTCRGDEVWATLLRPAATATLPGVALGATGDARDLAGAPVPTTATSAGLLLDLREVPLSPDAPPLVVGLRGAVATMG